MNYCVIILIASLTMGSALDLVPTALDDDEKMFDIPMPLEELDFIVTQFAADLNMTSKDYVEISALNVMFNKNYTKDDLKAISSKNDVDYYQDDPTDIICVGFEVTGPNCEAKYDSVFMAPTFNYVLGSLPKTSSAKYLTVMEEYMEHGCPCKNLKVTDGCNSALKKLMASFQDICERAELL